MQILSFPMRIQANGRLATVEQNSDDHLAEELAIICLSRPGERELVPEFGIDDPAFDEIHPDQVRAQASIFEVPVDVIDVVSDDVDDTVQDVTIYFEGVALQEGLLS